MAGRLGFRHFKANASWIRGLVPRPGIWQFETFPLRAIHRQYYRSHCKNSSIVANSKPMKELVLLAAALFSLVAQTAAERQVSPDLVIRQAAYERLFRDWAGLNRYGSENSEIPPPAPGETRVVFFGDQVTENWTRGSSQFFKGKPYFNRGIDGQTTAQMLVRFRQDVVGLKPRVVIIQGGTNDLTGMMGPGTE